MKGRRNRHMGGGNVVSDRADEQYLELPGLQPDEGATLFLRYATPVRTRPTERPCAP